MAVLALLLSYVGASSIARHSSARLGRASFWVLPPRVVLSWLSTLHLRYHYLVDVFAGWALAVLYILLARRLLRLEGMAREFDAAQP